MPSTTVHIKIPCAFCPMVEGIINLVHCDSLKVIIRTGATDVVDCVHINKKSALNIWIVKIVKETVA
jgi:hypothetical protein